MSISFDNPWYLLLIPAAALFLFITQFFMFTREKGKKIGQILVRAFLFLALILSLAGFGLKFTGRNTTTIYLLDVSDSVRDSKQDLVTFVNESVKDKKKHDYVSVIAFGEDSMVEQFTSENLAFSKFQREVNTGATNLEEAVNLALSQLPDDSAGRIVLVTDGNENEGALKSIASEVIASGCAFEVKKLEENVSDEVYVSDLSVPNQVSIGEKFNIEVEVESNVACDATVKLYAGRTLKGEQTTHLQKGTNKIIFADTQSDEGLKTYKVVVEAQKDTMTVNNEFSAYTNIETQLPLLVVEGQDGNTANFKRILDSLDVGYDIVTPNTVPVDMATLMQYSAVVFVDVFAGDLRDGFVDTLNDYVKNNGGGFIITGGSNSYALGGYRDTLIEEMSPVYMDLNPENEIPSMAMCMVIDHSGSMSDGNGVVTLLDLAKQAASAAVDYLRPDDYVEVIAFDDTYSRVVPLCPCEDKGEIQKKISGIPMGGGTSIYPALEAAINDLVRSDAMVKHVILLTDGQDYNDDYDDLIRIANDAGITVSCVALGSGCNTQLLQRIANDGKGRMFTSDIDTDLPRIFAQEVFLASNTYLVNETFSPTVTSNDKVIREVVEEAKRSDMDGLPNLYGYVATTKKDRSIQLLASYQQNDPILAYWQYGLGKTVAWTSDVSGEWTAAYSEPKNAEITSLMWHNIIKLVSEDNGLEGTYANVEQNGNKATITYNTDKYDANSKVMAYVYDENGEVKEIELDPKKPGVYEAQIDTKETGIYMINVQQKDGEDIVSSINTAAIMQYSLEYRFYPDNTLLEDFVASTGGTFIENPEDVFAIKPEFVKARFNLWIPLLIIASLIFLFDIAVRRFNFSLAFVDKAAAKRETNKIVREEMKRKEEAANLKEEVARNDAMKEAQANQVVPEKKASKKKKEKVSAQPEVDETLASTTAFTQQLKKTNKKMNEEENARKSIFDDMKANSGSSKTFERKPGDAVPTSAPTTPQFKAPKKPATPNKGAGEGTGSLTSASLKTRVWVRDDDK
jgi:uncharacterized membrane protein